MKVCRICREELPLEAFHLRKVSPDGRRNDCRECNLTRQREYTERTKDKARTRRKAWYEAQRERVIQERRDFRVRERERISAQRRARHAANPEHNRALARARRARDPERYRRAQQKRGFKRRAHHVTFLLERDGDACGICGEPLDLHELEIDHIHPRSKGGSNDYGNLQLAHVACNRAKGTQIMESELAID